MSTIISLFLGIRMFAHILFPYFGDFGGAIMSFIERLEIILSEKKISKSQLLSNLNLGKNQFTYWKNKNTIPNGFTVQAIADYLNVSVDYLLGKSEQKEKPSTDDEELNRLLKITDNLSDENLQKLLDYGNLLLKSQD